MQKCAAVTQHWINCKTESVRIIPRHVHGARSCTAFWMVSKAAAHDGQPLYWHKVHVFYTRRLIRSRVQETCASAAVRAHRCDGVRVRGQLLEHRAAPHLPQPHRLVEAAADLHTTHGAFPFKRAWFRWAAVLSERDIAQGRGTCHAARSCPCVGGSEGAQRGETWHAAARQCECRARRRGNTQHRSRCAVI